jgi:hypothetical protein
MSLPRVDFVLEVSRTHLDTTGSRNTEIDSILAAFACSVIYAALEKRVVEAIAERAGDHVAADASVRNFARVSARRLTRSILVGQLSGLAGHFGDQCKEDFRRACEEEAIVSWDAVIRNRHEVAHEGESGAEQVSLSSLTFADVEMHYGKCLAILTAFEEALAT